jgi:hypothetical protein
MNVDVSEVDRLRDLLERAPERSRKVSRGQAMRMLAPQLRKLRAKGYSVEDLAALLTEHGWTVSVDTLRGYVGGKRGRGAATKPAADGSVRRASEAAGAQPPAATAIGTEAAAGGGRPSALPAAAAPKESVPASAAGAAEGAGPRRAAPAAAPPRAEVRAPAPPPPSATFRPREDRDDL